MYHSRDNRKKYRFHERCITTVCSNKKLPFNKLLEKDGSVSIYEQNLQVLATKMHQISNGPSMPLMKVKFPINKIPYILRQNFQFSRAWINTVYHGTKGMSNIGRQIWDLVPSNLKEICDLDEFWKAIKQWKREYCPCRLCKVLVENIGFLKEK